MAEDAYQLVWTHHHILLDGWCTGLVLKELFAFYEAFRRGETPRLEHSRPYREYIAWLRQQDAGHAEKFWRGALQGFTAPTRLGVEPRDGSEVPGAGEIGEESLCLSRASTQALEVLARQQQVTLNTVLQGAWALLLSRYSLEDDVVFGTTVSGRPAELTGVTSMLGLFINTLPVRVRVRPQQRTAEYLKALQEQQVEARQYEYSALVDIHGWSEVPRDTPLFESLLVFENYPVNESLRSQDGQTLSISALRHYDRTNYPLTVVALPGAELKVDFVYERRRFDAGRVGDIARHLGHLLEGMAANPEVPLLDLSMLGEEERHRLLVKWNDTAVEYPAGQLVHELFSEQARLRPGAVAVALADRSLTYGEVEARSNRLAHHLRSLGVGPEVLVGVCAEWTLERVVGIVAVLKAGGAY
ncbi:MAG TPA: condensation domain-containing protein, partial [Myxococcota bacterium]|nr:condensation domain-containing protein [Myxococcota bacterium]